jgi:hypothetical protein
MHDPINVLAGLMILVSLMGFAFQAGINKARRDARRWYR